MQEYIRNYRESLLSDEQVEQVLADPGFGRLFSEHMVSIDWSREKGWHNHRVEPYGPIQLEPSAMVLHYGQEIFEGLKVFRHEDGSIQAFRPERNAERLQSSAARMALPQLPVEDFISSLREWARVDSRWVPKAPMCMYTRPFMIATEPVLGVRPSDQVRYMLICSPVTDLFKNGVKPVRIWVSTEYSRAAKGGTGAVKCGGNYAASLLPQQEAAARGFEQVLYLDSTQGRNIEEVGAMNIFFVTKDGKLITPQLTGTILPGITRDSVIQLGRSMGLEVSEQLINIDQLHEGWKAGEITEVFGCGTAAAIIPVGELAWEGGRIGDNTTGPVTAKLREQLLDIQYGRSEDTNSWMVRIDA